MAFRFKLGESFDEGARRIAAEQIDHGLSLLQSNGDQVVSIHETRKSLKRLRALLRLIRPAIGDNVFKQENAALREIGLSLSGARDRHVLLETLDKLEASVGFGRRTVADQMRRSIAAVNGVGALLTMQEAHDRLMEAKARLAVIKINGDGFDVVGGGLERSYRRARRAFGAAYAHPSDEGFHEWRKGAQAHWRHMTLLSRAWPDYLGARALEARTLSQLIGDDHDLALLIAFAHSDAAGLNAEQAAAVESAARQRQGTLRAMARPRGERLFAASPKRLCKSIAAYWNAATALKAQELDATKVSGAPKRVRRKGTGRRRAASGEV